MIVQLKEKRRANGGGVGAIEELENAFNLAEESCPGISDRLVTHMMERVCRSTFNCDIQLYNIVTETLYVKLQM